MKNELMEIIANTICDVSQQKMDNLDIHINSNIYSPIWQNSDKILIDMPIPKKLQEKINYFGYSYDDSITQIDSIWGLFSASLYHIGAHVNLTDYSIYKKWSMSKIQKSVWKTIDFIEDTRVNHYLEVNFPEEFSNIQAINKSIDRFYEKYAKKSTLDLNVFSKKFFKDYPDLLNILKSKIITESNKNNLIKIADYLYHNQIFLPITSYPYVESHQNKLNPTYENHPYFELTSKFQNLSVIFGKLWTDMIIHNESILQKYQNLARDLHFDSVRIGEENFTEYLRLKRESALFLKKLRIQLSRISNIIDEPNSEDVGLIDMQKAIQTISANDPGIQIFEQDTTRRIDENWAIIIDNSKSMAAKFSEIKKFTLCLAETADALSSRGGSWGLYSFNNTFSIIKDHNEKYSQSSKGRIGGIENNGLSFIADSITLTTRIMSETQSDKKFIFVISDGNALGYAGADSKFREAVIEARKTGISIIGIGMPQGIVKNFTISLPYETMRKTVANLITAYIQTVASIM